MTTKFEVEGYGWSHGRISPIQITRETDTSVWVGSRRHAKRTEYRCFFDTWEEAHAFLMQRAEIRLTHARRSLQNAQDILGNVKGMKKPEAV